MNTINSALAKSVLLCVIWHSAALAADGGGSDSVTVTDRALCSGQTYSSQIENETNQNNAANNQTRDFTDDGSVYRVGENRWSLEKEKAFAQWVHENVGQDLLSKYKIESDCASATWMVRAIFARVQNLPSYCTDGSSHISQSSHRWSNLRMVLDWSGDKWKTAMRQDLRFRAFLNACGNLIHTTTLAPNAYPVRITDPEHTQHLSPYVKEGTVLLTNDHARFISSIDASDGNYLPVFQLESTVPKRVNTFNVNTFDIDYPEEIGRGVLNWRWPLYCRGGWVLLPSNRMPGYSFEQYEWAQSGSLAEALRMEQQGEKDYSQILQTIAAKRSRGLSGSIDDFKDLRAARAHLSALHRDIAAYRVGNGKPRPTENFRILIQSLARGSDDPPDAKVIDVEIKILLTKLQERVQAVRDAQDILRRNPHAFADPASTLYDDYSTPSRDHQFIAQMLFLETLLRDNDKKRGTHLVSLLGQKLAEAKLEIGEGHRESLLYLWRGLIEEQISSDPGRSFSERWGFDFTSHLSDRQRIRTAEVAHLRALLEALKPSAPSGHIRIDNEFMDVPTDQSTRANIAAGIQRALDFGTENLKWLAFLASSSQQIQ